LNWLNVNWGQLYPLKPTFQRFTYLHIYVYIFNIKGSKVILQVWKVQKIEKKIFIRLIIWALKGEKIDKKFIKKVLKKVFEVS